MFAMITFPTYIKYAHQKIEKRETLMSAIHFNPLPTTNPLTHPPTHITLTQTHAPTPTPTHTCSVALKDIRWKSENDSESYTDNEILLHQPATSRFSNMLHRRNIFCVRVIPFGVNLSLSIKQGSWKQHVKCFCIKRLSKPGMWKLNSERHLKHIFFSIHVSADM